MNEDNPIVFVVDDDRSIRESLRNLIRSVGLNVQTFASAQEFLTSQRPEAPSCLVLDVKLPGLNGLDLQQELAKADVQIPIIFMTGYGDIPMTVRAMKSGAVEFFTKPFRVDHMLNAVEQAIDRSRQIEQLKKKPSEEKQYSEDELRSEISLSEIVGQSAALRRVLNQVETVARTDSTVLIYGETGTGKEMIASAIHNLSLRRSNPFVKLNCAAIPTGLLESDFFGHEKGAFTGAAGKRIGRFEFANSGTLFLDEIGDMPLELQPKLLRVIQEQEFERLGSTRTIHVDVRLVVATNSDLSQMVLQKQFRSDLYYRLNVFPIVIPPLRERREDIPLLVRHFVQKHARRMKKRIDALPTEAITALSEYHWPGNVRELENFIERAVILSEGTKLPVPVHELESEPREETQPVTTLKSAERDHIMRALHETKWIIGGHTGAAAKLGMKRTTLQSKIRKHGISRPN